MVSILSLGMNILNISNIHTIGKFIIPLISPFETCFGYLPPSPLVVCLDKKRIKKIHLRKRKIRMKSLLKRLGKFI